MSARSAMFLTYAALIALLAITAGSSRVNLGAANLMINLAIAGIKTLLILFIFMQLRLGPALDRLVAAVICLWLAILYLLTLADYATR